MAAVCENQSEPLLCSVVAAAEISSLTCMLAPARLTIALAFSRQRMVPKFWYSCARSKSSGPLVKRGLDCYIFHFISTRLAGQQIPLYIRYPAIDVAEFVATILATRTSVGCPPTLSSVRPPVHPSVHPSARPSVCPFVRPYVRLSVCTSVCQNTSPATQNTRPDTQSTYRSIQTYQENRYKSCIILYIPYPAIDVADFIATILATHSFVGCPWCPRPLGGTLACVRTLYSRGSP